MLLVKLPSRLDGRDGDLTRPSKLLRTERRDRIGRKEVSDSTLFAGLLDELSVINGVIVVVAVDCVVECKLRSWTVEWWSSGG